MNRRTRRGIEVAIGGLIALAIVVVGGVALLVHATHPPLYTDAATIPSTTAPAPSARDAKAVEESRRRARQLLVAENMPNLSVAVARAGEIVWAEGFGYTDGERRAMVTPHTRFRTGSVSKTMTAAAVALLVDRKRIDLDAPVQTYVPAYPKKQWAVTTRQLLGDVAGVHRLRGDGADGGNDQLPRGICRTVDEALRTFAYEPLAFEPGTKYRFSTSGWILVSAVVEGAAGEPFPTFMRRELFTPLRMERTALEGTDDDTDAVVGFRATPEFEDRLFGGDASEPNKSAEPKDLPAADYSCTVGGGAFLSTPSDLVRLGSAMLTTSAKATAVKRPGFLKDETITLFQTPLRLKSGAPTGFALGWKVDDVQLAGVSTRAVRHRASLIGGYVTLTLFPERQLAIAAMANAKNALVDDLALQVAAAFARQPD